MYYLHNGLMAPLLSGQNPGDIHLQAAVEQEFAQHKDLVQGNFVDSYFNNTWKTALGFRWAVEHCPKARVCTQFI
jgi:hypothetical protein